MGQNKGFKSTGPQRMHRYGAIPNSDAKVKVIKTGNKHFDAFVSLWGGLIRGTSMFLTGTSGAGKTTLSVFLQSLLSHVKTVLYSREMSANAIQRQCNQYKVSHGNAFIADGESCPTFKGFLAMLERECPDVVIMDSLQEIAKDFTEEMGTEKAIKHIVDKMREYADKHDAVVIFIGQMNKDGTFNGPQSILQLADAHMEMTFYPKRRERVISWGGKNRNTKDPSEIMYYTLGDGVVTFYSEAEWKIEREKLTFVDFMLDAARRYLGAMKDRDGYSTVRKRVQKFEDKLNSSNVSDEEFFLSVTQEINRAVNETWPKTVAA